MSRIVRTDIINSLKELKSDSKVFAYWLESQKEACKSEILSKKILETL